MTLNAAIHAKAVEIGKLSIEMTTAAGSGHPSTCLSLAHITTVLMYHVMRWDPADPWSKAADKLVLSEGHAVPIIYAACADLGVMMGKQVGIATPANSRPMTRDDALQLRDIDSPVDGHPHPVVGFPFFDAATGSLGQGLSVAAGLAKAARIDGIDRNIFCVIGDGESREGSIWEACDFIVDEGLTNCVPIFNCNVLAQSDFVSPQQSADVLADKLAAYGFHVAMIDGHDPESLRETFASLPMIQNGKKPLAVVARTVKGWGSPSEQGMGHHGKPVGDVKDVFAELDETLEVMTGGDGGDGGDGGGVKIGPGKVTTKAKPMPTGAIKVDASAALEEAGYLKKINEGGKVAPRRAYGAALKALAAADERIVGLDADVKNSTYAETMYKAFPERFVECRIAEQHMISAAAGLSAAGKIPMCSTFAKFVMRAYDQLEMAINGGANFKVTGSHAGVTLAADGPSQMSLPDAAFFRAFCHTKHYNGNPAAIYFFPSDAVSTFHITTLMANHDGFAYLRTLREDVPALYKVTDTDFTIGGFKVVREGTDVVFVTAGYMVHECLRAADKLGGKKASVIDAYGMPMQAEKVIEFAQKHGGKVVVVEDNYTGGLDAEVAIAVAKTRSDVTVKSLNVNMIPKSGRTPEDVLKYLSLDADTIAAAVG